MILLLTQHSKFENASNFGVIQTKPATTPSDLVSVQSGNIPIILSAPHGGSARVPGAPPGGRKTGTIIKDKKTLEIAQLVARRIKEELYAEPFYVLALFSRKDIDANRPPEEAFEWEGAGVYYQQYHQFLESYVRQIAQQFGKGILIDIHGQVSEPEAVFRGTHNQQTVSYMLRQFGKEAFLGPNSFVGQLEAAGYPIKPMIGEQEVQYTGGYIVRHYGSHKDNGIDSIQCEIGSKYRTSKRWKKTAEDIAKAVIVYFRTYFMNS